MNISKKEVKRMIKLSETLLDAAKKAAKMALERDLDECPIPGLESSYLVSKSDIVPNGYIELETIEVEGVPFHIYQLL